MKLGGQVDGPQRGLQRHAAALSYDPANEPARTLYASLGFRETGETVDGESVARPALD